MHGPMVEKKIPSALPIYLAAVVFFVCALLLPIYQMWAILLAAALSAAAWGVSRRLIPPRVVMVPAPGPVYATGERELDDVLNKASGDLDALHALNARIPDEALSRSIDRMETAGRAILKEVAGSPEKAREIRKFAAYYLPTAVKVLTQYAELEAAGATGENARALEREVKANGEIIAKAFEAQLDALFAGDVLDVSSDLEVLNAMARGDGLAGSAPDRGETPGPSLRL